MLRALALLALLERALAQSISIPSNHTSSNLVYSNFLGISFESSQLDAYFGQSSSTISQTAINYLSNIRTRSQRPLRIRIGGNSMDDTFYDPNQSAMIVMTGVNNTANKQPAILGPAYFDVLNAVAEVIGGAQIMIGLPLLEPSNPNISELASAAEQKLNRKLDAFLLGNEPDLYGPHGDRAPGYTVENYLWDFSNVTTLLRNSSYGNLLSGPILGGPTICCNWELDDLIQQGYLTQFGADLKYINLQHYPQDNCFGSFKYQIDYYLQHRYVVELSQWQIPGVSLARNASKEVTLGEFNTASCGGIPGISDTFAATMWTIDYSLQLASVGYTAAYIHTREAGISYNLFDPPANGSDWKTLPSYYALLPIAEVLRNDAGSYVIDLNLNNSTLANSTVAGYAIYDGNMGSARALTLFNYADQGASPANFTIPIVAVSPGANETKLTVRYLTAATVREKTQISWGGQTLANKSDGIMVDSKTAQDVVVDCSNGCSVEVPSPAVAVVWINSVNASDTPQPNDAQSNNAMVYHNISLVLFITFGFANCLL